MADWSVPFEARLRYVRVDCRTWLETDVISGIASGGTIEVDGDAAITTSGSLTSVVPLSIGGDYIRVYLDAAFRDGSSASMALGTFAATQPARDISASGSLSVIDMYGVLSVLSDSFPEGTVTVPSGGDPVAAACSAISAIGLRVSSEPTPQRLADGRTYGVVSIDGVEDDRLSIVNDLMATCSFLPAREDAMGTILLRRRRDDAARIPDHSFVEGPDCRFLADMTEEMDVSVCNCVKVIASCGKGVVVATVKNQDPADPYSTVSLGREMWEVVRPEDAMSYEDALKLAQDTLRGACTPKRTVTFQHIFAPLAIDDIVMLSYPSRGLEGRFRIKAISYDLESPGVLMDIKAEEVL